MGNTSTLSTGEDSAEKYNRIDASEVTDERRAGWLDEWLTILEREFGQRPKLMPLGEEGKRPWIGGKCRLESDEAAEVMVSGDDAVEQIQDGADGFVCYAGRPDHNTERIVFIDHDDVNEFPSPTGKATLEVLSGSGRGPHETYRNDPADPVANSKVGPNNDAGEVRVKNWYVVVPGSIHPDGGVYYPLEPRGITTISDSDLSDEQRPSGSSSRTEVGANPIISDVADSAFGDPDMDVIGMVRGCIREFYEDAGESAKEELQDLKMGKYRKNGYRTKKNGITRADRSAAECALFGFVFGIILEHGDVARTEAIESAGMYLTHIAQDEKWTQDGQLRKWIKRPRDYRDRTASEAVREYSSSRWKSWAFSTGHDEDYSWLTYHYLILAATVECSDSGVYDPESYPEGRTVREVAADLDANPRSDETYRTALSRLKEEHGQLKMACIEQHVKYVYYPKDAPDPDDAVYVKHGGERYKPSSEA